MVDALSVKIIPQITEQRNIFETKRKTAHSAQWRIQDFQGGGAIRVDAPL